MAESESMAKSEVPETISDYLIISDSGAASDTVLGCGLRLGRISGSCRGCDHPRCIVVTARDTIISEYDGRTGAPFATPVARVEAARRARQTTPGTCAADSPLAEIRFASGRACCLPVGP